MSVTALELAQRVAAELGLTEPSTLEGTTNETSLRLKACIDATGKHLRKQYDWPQLVREYVVTLPQDETFLLPPDMLKWNSFYVWDRTNEEKVRTVTCDEWQRRLATGFDAVVNPQTRARGYVRQARRETGSIDREPYTPTIAANYPFQIINAMLLYGIDSTTAQVGFEYVSKSWLHPPLAGYASEYKIGEIYSGMSYQAPNYELFQAQSNFASSSSADQLNIANLITGSTVGDWKIWGLPATSDSSTYNFYAYDKIRKNDDAIVLDEDAMTAGAKYRFRELQGLPYAEFKQDYYYAIDAVAGAIGGAKVVSATAKPPVVENIPEENWDL